jgi:hypothetical protein
MVLGHGASFSSNTLPSISSVMCGGVLKKCSICTSQKSNLYVVQLKMLQEPKAQHHCFAHFICATSETVSPFIYTTLPYVIKIIYLQVKTSVLTCMPPMLEFRNSCFQKSQPWPPQPQVQRKPSSQKKH